MSTVAHDAGIVYPSERSQYVVVILTEWQPDRSGRQSAIASLSRVVYQYVTAGDVHAR
jgi:beta-lactamase class A